MRLLVNLEFTAKDAVKAVQRRDLIIVIDVLRCSTTIVTALTNGAESIIPTKSVKKARMLHKSHPEYLLAGERRGIKPKGFDFGNSPLEFSSEVIKGKDIILTTTSGTKAIVLSKDAKWVLIGTFTNAKAVAKTAFTITEKEGIGISIVLSGKEGKFSLEDFLCAGLLVEKFPARKFEWSDAAIASYQAFQQSRPSLYKIIRSGSHARYMESIGQRKDLEFCSKTNVSDVVPSFKNGAIVPLSSSTITI